MRVLKTGTFALLTLLLPTTFVFAQASISGVVKDTSGAVLPGVTVEASSPALIEKSRTTVTDGNGAYQIIQLQPGIYTVSFTLPGFSGYKREGLELGGNFVATVTAELKVGSLAETVTVRGETPLVDVRSSSVQKVVTKEVVDAIPTGRLGINLAALQPGIILGAGGGVGQANTNSLTSQDVGGTAGDTFTDLSIHGGKPAEQRQTIGGVSAATTIRFGESLSSSPSFTAMQEMTVNTSGADASQAGGGVQMNYVPRDGGNTFRGLLYTTFANNGTQAQNYSSGVRDASGTCSPVASLFCRGLRTQPGELKETYDFNPGYGGPLIKDRLWFFATARWTKAENYVPNEYPNTNFIVGKTSPTLLNTTTLTYNPNVNAALGTTYGGGGYFWEQTLRLSWQINSKDKVGIYYNNKKREYTNGATGTSLESLATTYFFPFSDNLVQWTRPQTNRLLFEAAFWRHQETWGNRRATSDRVDPLAVGVTDNNPQTLVPDYIQLIQNYHGRVGATDTPSHNPNYRANVAMSYVTGSHSWKTGVDFNGANRVAWTASVIPYSYVVSTLASNGVGIGIPVATTLTLRSDGCTDPLIRQVNGTLVGGHTSVQPGCPTPSLNKVTSEGGAFVQDKWTMDRLTLSAGVRLDWFFSENPAYHLGASLLTPNRSIDVPKFSTARYKDWTPKFGVAYDLFGNGKTALKGNIGRYVLGQALVFGLSAQPGYNLTLTSSRAWVDNNKNWIPDCDLANPATQGPTQTGANFQIDTCNAPAGLNANFYDNQLRPNLAVQDDARYGWGKRPFSWETSVSLQHELNRNVSLNGGVFWRWFGNFLVTDNTSATVSNFTPYSITPSLIPPSPASAGGETLPDNIYTSGFYNINSGVQVNNLQGLSKTMFPGSNVYDRWFGFDLGMSARLPDGIIVQGGLSTGHQTTDFCDVQDPAKAGDNALVEMLGSSSVQSCHMEQNWLPQVKFLGSYTVPKIDVQIGAAFQSIPGVEYAASYAAPNTDLSRPVADGGLGRLPTGGTATQATNVNIVPPGTLFGPRLNQIDLRLGKIIRVANTRSTVGVDLFNILNNDTVTQVSSTYVGTWLAPQGIIAPRLLKVSLTFDF